LTPFPTRRSSDLHQGLSGRSQARSGSSGRTGGGRRSRCPAAGSRTHHRGRPHPVGRAIPPDAPGHLWRYWLTHLGPASCPRGLDSDANCSANCPSCSAGGILVIGLGLLGVSLSGFSPTTDGSPHPSLLTDRLSHHPTRRWPIRGEPKKRSRIPG